MPRLRTVSEIRWYLYRSASKLAMLYEQFVATSRPFTGGVEVSVPGIKASLGTVSDEPPNDDEKLAMIERELRARALVGTIDSPGEYFAMEMPMRWGLFNDQGARPSEEPPLVFFGGLARPEGIVVGLGGSSKYVVGHFGASSTYSRSTTPAIVGWLLAGLEDTKPRPIEPEAEHQEVLEAVTIALHYLRPPTQKLQFLAKTLLSGTLHGGEHMTGLPRARIVLGTPLYVTLSEAPRDEDRWGLDDQW